MPGVKHNLTPISSGRATAWESRYKLIAVGAIAVVACIAWKGYGNLSVYERLHADRLWPATLALVVALLACSALLRIRAERKAGDEHFRLKPVASWFGASSILGHFGAGLLWIGLSLWILKLVVGGGVLPPRTRPEIEHYALIAFLCAALIALGVGAMWWGRAVRVCEHGVLHYLFLIKYENCLGYRWHLWRPNVLLIETGYFAALGAEYIAVRVTPEQRPEIEAFLQQRVGRVPSALDVGGPHGGPSHKRARVARRAAAILAEAAPMLATLVLLAWAWYPDYQELVETQTGLTAEERTGRRLSDEAQRRSERRERSREQTLRLEEEERRDTVRGQVAGRRKILEDDWNGDLPRDVSLTDESGGEGGEDYCLMDSQRRPVVGFHFIAGNAPGDAFNEFVPFYERADSLAKGSAAVLAKEGYVVSGIIVDADRHVRAIKVIFARESGDRLDRGDSYESEWLGEPQGASPAILGNSGELVIGTYGGRGLYLDSVGLVTKPAE